MSELNHTQMSTHYMAPFLYFRMQEQKSLVKVKSSIASLVSEGGIEGTQEKKSFFGGGGWEDQTWWCYVYHWDVQFNEMQYSVIYSSIK